MFKKRVREEERKKRRRLLAFLRLLSFSSFDAFVLVVGAGVPCESLLVELDDHLGTLDVGGLGEHEVGLVRVLPLHEEHELAARVGRADDLLGQEAAVETTQRVVVGGVRRRLVLVGVVVVCRRRASGRSRRGRRGALGSLLLLGIDLGLRLALRLRFVALVLRLVVDDQVLAVEVLLGLPRVLVPFFTHKHTLSCAVL